MQLYNRLQSFEGGPEFLAILHEANGGKLSWAQSAASRHGALTVAHSLGSIQLIPGISSIALLPEGTGLLAEFSTQPGEYNGMPADRARFSGISTRYEDRIVSVSPFSGFVFGDLIPEEVVLFDSCDRQVYNPLGPTAVAEFIFFAFEKMVIGGIKNCNGRLSTSPQLAS